MFGNTQLQHKLETSRDVAVGGWVEIFSLDIGKFVFCDCFIQEINRFFGFEWKTFAFSTQQRERMNARLIIGKISLQALNSVKIIMRKLFKSSSKCVCGRKIKFKTNSPACRRVQSSDRQCNSRRWWRFLFSISHKQQGEQTFLRRVLATRGNSWESRETQQRKEKKTEDLLSACRDDDAVVLWKPNILPQCISDPQRRWTCVATGAKERETSSMSSTPPLL